MDTVIQKFKSLLAPYKYVLAVLILGMALMLLPEKKTGSQTEAPAVQQKAADLSEQLEDILSQIKGVGKVRVLLTLAQGEQTLYVYDESGTEGRREAVVITDEDRAQDGLVSQVLPPTYQGAVVVCQGGDVSTLRLQIVEAVCDATGLTADKVSVLKMK